VEWAGGTRVVATGKTDQLQRQKLQRQKLQRSAKSLATHRQERLSTDIMKMVLKSLGKACKGQEQADRVKARLVAAGLEGIQIVVATKRCGLHSMFCIILFIHF
jgi:hypothetical protein